jgi:tripeptide aminopeptidase
MEQNIMSLIISKIIQYKALITTDGTTLLGADDKAVQIVTAMEFLINNPEIKHGKIRVGFLMKKWSCIILMLKIQTE